MPSDSVYDGVAVLADSDDSSDFPKAVGHLLGDAPRSAQLLGEIGGSERLGQIVGQETSQVLGVSEKHRVHHLDQSTFNDRPTLAAP